MVITMDEYIKHSDVVNVVRCKDCKHLTDDGLCWENIHAVVGYKTPNPNDFCSFGEWKEGDGE